MALVCPPRRVPRYRPRHPERTTLYRVLEQHFDRYERVHAERFAPRSGALRRVVRDAVYAFLDCGRLFGGFARIRCPSCLREHLLAFSCRTRNLCPSCQSKRSALFAEWLVEEVLLDVPHRHVVFTVPKRLRGLIERERRLHGVMARAAYRTLREALGDAAVEPDGRPGAVVSLQTFGSYGANFHPHLHTIVTAGVFTPDGRFHAVIWPPEAELEERFRVTFLELLVRARRMRPETRERLLGWRHSGFSVKTSQHIGAGQRERLERLARYATRVVVGAGAVRSSERGRVVVETPADPKSGSTVLELDALDFVHAVCQQIPDRGMHLVRYYGAYANRTRRRVARARAQLAGSPEPETESASTRTPPARPGSVEAIRRQAWARLIKKVFEVDPLACPRCGAEMVVVAWIHEPAAIDRILTHRRQHGLVSPFDARAPPTT